MKKYSIISLLLIITATVAGGFIFSTNSINQAIDKEKQEINNKIESLLDFISSYYQKKDYIRIHTLFRTLETAHTRSITIIDADDQNIKVSYANPSDMDGESFCDQKDILYYGQKRATIRFCIDIEALKATVNIQTKGVFILFSVVLFCILLAVSLPLLIFNHKVHKIFEDFNLLQSQSVTAENILNLKNKIDYQAIRIVIQKFYEVFIAREELNKRLNEQSKLAAIGTATSLISHDIRRPFNNLKTFLDMLPNHLNDQEYIKETSASIIGSVNSVSSMLDDMMEFSKKKEMVIESVDLDDFFRSIIKELFLSNQKSPIQFDISIPEDFTFQFDKNKMSRVFQNLICNANEAMKGKGTIWLNVVRGEGEHICIILGDDGPAIPKDNLSQLLEPFATFGKTKGTGLGLAISNQIVQAHGGQIQIYNTPNGPEFKLIFPFNKNQDVLNPTKTESFRVSDLYLEPIQKKESVESAQIREKIDPLQQIRDKIKKVRFVLIIDNDSIQLEQQQNILSEVFPNADIITCKNSSEAKDLSFEFLFNLVISEYNLGQDAENGIDTINAMKKIIPDSIYLLASNQDIKLEDESIFIKKPITVEKIVQKLG